MSAATESTLDKLLKTSERMSSNIAQLAIKSGVDAKNLRGFTSDVGNMSNSVKDTDNALEKIVKTVKNTIGGINDLGNTASKEGGRVSSFYSELSQLLPDGGVLQQISDASTALAIEYERNLVVYQDLAKSGVNFGGSLGQVAVTAGKAYMTMEQFSTVVKENSDVFTRLTGNVETGMNRFVSIQNEILGKDSPYAKRLAGLGLTSQETAEAMANYMRTQVNLQKSELQTNDSIMAGTMGYVLELDTLSKITGKRREQIEKEYKEVAEEESFRQYLAGLKDDEAKAARAAINSANQMFGKDVANQLRTAIQTGVATPLTEGQRDMYVLTGGATQNFVEQMMASVKEGKSIDDIQKQSLTLAVEAGKTYKQVSESLNPVLGINAAFGTGLRAGNAEILGRIANMPIGEVGDFFKKIQEQQKNASEGSAVSMVEAQLRITEMGAKIKEIKTKFLDPIIDLLSQATSKVTTEINNILGSDFVTKMTDELSGGLKKLNESIKSGEFGAKLKENLKGFFDKFGAIFNADSLVGALGAAGDLGSYMFKGISDLWDSILPSVGPVIGAIFIKIKNYTLDIIEKYIPLVDTIDEKIKSEEDKLKKSREALANTPVDPGFTAPSGRRRQDFEKQVQESEARLKGLQGEKAERGKTFSEIVDELKKEYSKPKTQGGTQGGSQSGQGNTSGTGAGTPPAVKVEAEKTGLIVPATDLTGTKLAELSNTMKELLAINSKNSDTSEKMLSALRNLNSDGFAQA